MKYPWMMVRITAVKLDAMLVKIMGIVKRTVLSLLTSFLDSSFIFWRSVYFPGFCGPGLLVFKRNRSVAVHRIVMVETAHWSKYTFD